MAAARVVHLADSFEDFLEQENAKDLLRFTTAGSVDDGKSTLIGRLLYDSQNVYEDQIESVAKASAGRNAGAIDFSLLTDGLRAEREQGITIDVAYRYFATPRRKFIIADTPGHEQYTRNMVTGASTADLAIVLVDARKGLLPQSRRHAYIAALLGLSHIVVAVNKMDLVDYDRDVFAEVEADFRGFLSRFPSLKLYFLPISALKGDNVVTRSNSMRWFRGPSLLEYLERVPTGNQNQQLPLRFPVQRVVRPEAEVRGYSGTIASGSVAPGDPVMILPSGRKTRIAGIATFDGDLGRGFAGQSVTLTLSDEIDVVRGDMIAAPEDPPQISSSIEATLVWLSDVPADVNRRYRLKHTTRQEWAEIEQIRYRINVNTLAHEAAETLEMNGLYVVNIGTGRPLTVDSHSKNRTTGSFILIDPVTNATVAAGLIAKATTSKANRKVSRDPHINWHLENGRLVLSVSEEARGFSAEAVEGERSTPERVPLEDPEALEAFHRLLAHLGVSLGDSTAHDESEGK